MFLIQQNLTLNLFKYESFPPDSAYEELRNKLLAALNDKDDIEIKTILSEIEQKIPVKDIPLEEKSLLNKAKEIQQKLETKKRTI